MALLIVLAAVLSIALSRVHMPALIGFILAGVVIANFFSLSADFMEVVEVFSNIGLIMLMFAIGMEIDIRKIKENGVFAITVAAVQLPLMVIGGAAGGMLLGFTFLQSIALGCIISGSSTAVVLAVLKAQGTLKKEHIEMLVLITIMEDIGQVVMLSMLTPVLQGNELDGQSLMMLILNIAVFMGLCFVVGLRVVPRFIDWIAGRVSDELISILCVGLAFALAFMANMMGLSVAVGAFLMGVMIASTVKKDIVEHFVEPLRIMFMAMFFISVGMEVTISGLTDNIVLILIIFMLFAILKTVTVFIGYWIGNAEPRNGFVSATALCAMGEFAFIIAKQALDTNVFDDALYSSVIGAALVSMFLLPITTRYTGRLWDGMEARTPMRIRNWCARRNAARSDFYAVMESLPGKGRKIFNTSIGWVYICIVMIFVIEIVFYYAYPPASWWLKENYGDVGRYWDLLLMSINFWLLFLPCRVLVAKARNIFYAYAVGRMVESRDKVEVAVERVRFYEAINPLLAAVALDIFIIIVFPTESDSIYAVINFIIGLAAVILIRYYRIKKGTARIAPLPSLEDDTE